MNPAVDVSTTVSALQPSEKLRCAEARYDPGGGGINVSRVLKRLGSATSAIFPAGGQTGKRLSELLDLEEIPQVVVPIADQTREDFSVRELGTGAQYRFVLPGPRMTAAEVADCVTAVAERLRPGMYLVASGSLPPGVPSDFYAKIARLAADSAVHFILDTSGAALETALGEKLFLIKPSRTELEQLVGAELHGDTESLAAAKSIVARGNVEFVALSRGRKGAMLIGKDISLKANAASVEVRTTIGAGDSFLAALVLAFARGDAPSTALKFAAAAGGAALISEGTGLCKAADVERLQDTLRVEPIG